MNELEFLDDRLRSVFSPTSQFGDTAEKDFSGIHQVLRLHIQVPKWFCDDSRCPCYIFTERLSWALSHSRRTLRTERMLFTLMLTMSAKEAERVTTVLGFRISHDTLLRLLRQVPIPSKALLTDIAKK